ncbi:hypothetical protein Mal15_33410 [Stieleria maiorica]|uniref:Uncharacterized protein n=1 Tax=Stieleria maiorica TaxID=2795974 RepID=A0A5B9MFG7_9BACT|nr:hypothetical protein Mal15_33410 [Stieleria maiorica]
MIPVELWPIASSLKGELLQMQRPQERFAFIIDCFKTYLSWE